MFFFFFSSRRRHTRFDCDWSSDVCSSDLERYDGVFAERVCVPRRNLVPKPSALSFEEAACLPTAYLTAYKMLFGKSGVEPGATLLVQGAGGGVATALIVLGRAAGYRIWATSRSETKREQALKLGAD